MFQELRQRTTFVDEKARRTCSGSARKGAVQAGQCPVYLLSLCQSQCLQERNFQQGSLTPDQFLRGGNKRVKRVNASSARASVR